MVEGQLVDGSQALLIEDMITSGASKLVFVSRLRDAGALVEHCFVILDREQGGSETLQAEGVTLHALVTANSVLNYARRSDTLEESVVVAALEYLRDPDAWACKDRR
jgi:orotate phosphoribosyltransferase